MSSCRTRDIPEGDSGLGIEGVPCGIEGHGGLPEGVPGGISGDNEI